MASLRATRRGAERGPEEGQRTRSPQARRMCEGITRSCASPRSSAAREESWPAACSPDERRATELREVHREKVARNEVRPSPLWAKPCRACNVQIELDPRARSSLENVQRGLKQAEPELLACPPETLHVSLAWLLAVHVDYPVGKDALWERHGEEWTAELGRIAAQSAGFRIAYEHVVATDSAVIALARPGGPVNRIRGMIRERLRLPPRPATRLTWFTPPCSATAARSPIRSGSSPRSKTRAPPLRPRSGSWSSRRSWCTRRWKRRCSRASRSLPGELTDTPRRRRYGFRRYGFYSPERVEGLFCVLRVEGAPRSSAYGLSTAGGAFADRSHATSCNLFKNRISSGSFGMSNEPTSS